MYYIYIYTHIKSLDLLTFPARTHLPVAKSIFSISYSLIGIPPSSSGSFHFSLHPVSWMLLTSSGPFGFDGLPEIQTQIWNSR